MGLPVCGSVSVGRWGRRPSNQSADRPELRAGIAPRSDGRIAESPRLGPRLPRGHGINGDEHAAHCVIALDHVEEVAELADLEAAAP